MTGLYNMEAFRIKLVQLLEAEENPQENTYALTMVDVNNFSYVNENFGAEMGDSILKEFSRAAGTQKVMATCRMYSDYFLVLSGKEPAGDPEAR
ncbi:MAG: diguanylate cyclase domain-containing protein [Roseburia inulinivorans]